MSLEPTTSPIGFRGVMYRSIGNVWSLHAGEVSVGIVYWRPIHNSSKAYYLSYICLLGSDYILERCIIPYC